MATAPSKQSDQQDLSSKKPRRSVIRSLSWKRASKRTKMEDSEQEPGFEASLDTNVDTTVDNHEEVDSGGISFVAGSSHYVSDEDADDTIFDSSATSSSKKRKKAGVWKAMKRFFSRKSSKGSKSFTAGDTQSPHGQPQRSVSDPNLVHRTGERPDVAPLEQVDETLMETDAPPKKAISHDSLLSELRSKQRNSVDSGEESSPIKQKVPVVVQPKPSVARLKELGRTVYSQEIVKKPDGKTKPGDVMSNYVDWQASSTPEKLLPGLNVSHDKIRVAPRHRRAPTRKGVGSVRHGGHDITDGNVIPRSRSVGARIQDNVLVEKPQVQLNERDKNVLQEERENLNKRIEEEQRQRQKEEEQLKQQQLEQQKREQEKLEQERLEKQKLEEDKLEQEKLEKERLEQEKLEKGKLEQEKQEKLKQEKERLEQEKLEELKLEEEKLKQEKLGHEKREKERLDEEKRKQQESEKLRQYNVQQTTDFSDLVESLRPSGDAKETYRVETTEVEMKETTSEHKPEISGEMSETSAVEPRDIALYQNIDIVEKDVKTDKSNTINKQNTQTALDIKINNTADDRKTAEDSSQTASDFAVSPLLSVENTTVSAKQDIRETNEVKIVERLEESQPMSVSEEDVHAGITTSKLPESVLAVDQKISEVNTVVTDEKENSPPLSPLSATPSSPVRSKRLVIETPEKVYQKPIMAEVQAEEAESDEKSDGPGGIQRKRPQSMHSRIRPEVKENNQTQDDSNLGVARLTQAFERSSRSQTISYGEIRKKPEVLPKPKVASKPSQSQTLERNYRFPVTTNKTETFVQKSPKKQNDDVVVVLDEVPEKKVEKKESVLSSPTKKVPAPKPKPLPKPQLKSRISTPNVSTKTAEEGKENRKKTPNAQSVTNGSVKMSGTDSTDGKQHTGDESKDAQSGLPSFWARRSIFSPEQKTNSNSTSSQEEKTKEKHSPFIQLKTDTCAVCGSKVYQMEKFKVKDNIVHRSCIKCSVCKRLLSVGNFILSQNKIYCKPHEPHVTISLATV